MFYVQPQTNDGTLYIIYVQCIYLEGCKTVKEKILTLKSEIVYQRQHSDDNNTKIGIVIKNYKSKH